MGEADIPAEFGAEDPSFLLPNTAYASSAETGQVEDSWEVVVNYEFLQPRLALGISKSGPASVALGGTIQYTITVTNTGEAALTNVHVVDARWGLDETIASLAAGESVTFSPSYGPVTEADLPGRCRTRPRPVPRRWRVACRPPGA